MACSRAPVLIAFYHRHALPLLCQLLLRTEISRFTSATRRETVRFDFRRFQSAKLLEFLGLLKLLGSIIRVTWFIRLIRIIGIIGVIEVLRIVKIVRIIFKAFCTSFRKIAPLFYYLFLYPENIKEKGRKWCTLFLKFSSIFTCFQSSLHFIHKNGGYFIAHLTLPVQCRNHFWPVPVCHKWLRHGTALGGLIL